MARNRWSFTGLLSSLIEFRQKFSRDIVIDMYCYRRQGHNEADQAAFHPAGHRPQDRRPSDFREDIQTTTRRRRHRDLPSPMSRSLDKAIWDKLEEGYQKMQALQRGWRPHCLQRIHRHRPARAIPTRRSPPASSATGFRHIGRVLTTIPE